MNKMSDLMARIENHPSPHVLSPEGRGLGEGANGFTLLEVLLAMAIFAVVTTVIYVSFSTAGRNIEQAEALRDETDLARALITRLSTDIVNAYLKGNVNVVFHSSKEELNTEVGQTGEKIRHDSIYLTTLTNWRKLDSKETELWEVGYFFKEKPEGNGYTLFRREKRELSKDVPAGEGGDEYEITDRVESLRFSFSDNGSTWTDAGWDKSLNKLPKTVEIALTLDTGKVYVTKVDVGN